MGFFRELRKVTGGVAGAVEDVASGLGSVAKDFLSSPVGQIAMAYYAPVLGEAIGATMFASEIASGSLTAAQATAIGTGLASTGIQVANGVPLDDALKTSTATAAVSYGSPEAAKYINEQIAKPEVANALASVGGSVVKTAALGGNMDDIIKNAGAALAASGTESLTKDRMIGSAVGGAITGGAMGAATGAAGALGGEAAKTTGPAPVSDVTPEPVAVAPEVTPTPVAEVPPTAPVAEAPAPTPQFADIPVNDMRAGVQVAGPGGFQEMKPGTINLTSMGTYLGDVPVIIDSKTGQIVSATGTPEDIAKISKDVSILRVDTSKIAPEFLDRSPINPNITQAEFDALKLKSSPGMFDEFLKAVSKIDPAAAKAVMSSDANEVAGALAIPEIKALVDKAGSSAYLRELTEAFKDAIPESSYAKNLKEEIANTIQKNPNLATEEIQNILSAKLSPVQYVDLSKLIASRQVTPVVADTFTTQYTPSEIAPGSSLVIGVDPSTNQALVIDEKGNISSVEATGDIKKDQYVTIDPTTKKATAAKPLPTVSGATFTPFVEDTGTVTKGQTKTETPISNIPTAPSGGGGAGGAGTYAGGVTDRPSTTGKTTTPTTTPASPELPPVEDRTGKSTYQPELFVYGGQYPSTLGRSLGTDLQAGGAPTPTTGLTSYRAAGEIEASPGTERQNVWNEASLRLKDALGI